MNQPVTYTDRLKIAWLCVWRGVLVNGVLGGLFGFVIGFSFNVVGSPLREWTQLVSVLGGSLLGLFLGSPWIVGMMLRKQFRGFKLQVSRESN